MGRSLISTRSTTPISPEGTRALSPYGMWPITTAVTICHFARRGNAWLIRRSKEILGRS
ncbi:hypothetical protein FF36_03919 [Frankia torreyi]|uniref:Uncharacterized protein n=1 Tax=Frankia torreyi TaxID=1856 RepID=A0A0D8BCD4_9ACTN|nr:hypothetical protein FF36_03919 [Frankia torreyi]